MSEINSQEDPSHLQNDDSDVKACNCEKSKCLKLYCECFSRQQTCSKLCNCRDCRNNHMFSEIRTKAIQHTLEKNPDAFARKMTTRESNFQSATKKGCTCRRSNCLKNYCECYQKKIDCSHNCKCIGCQNNIFHKWQLSEEKGGNFYPGSEKDPTSAYLNENNYSWTIGIDFEFKNKRKISYFESL